MNPERSIPACAGEPGRPGQPRTGDEVYPRVCGGTLQIPLQSLPITGLSPRVRGNLFQRTVLFNKLGSIPACAGEPEVPKQMRLHSEVYPRVCGGTSARCRRASSGRGLSPRVRGNHLRLSEAFPAWGSIPACAGEPAIVKAFDLTKPVYPRVCGGTHPLRPGPLAIQGLSPRVRGNRACVHCAGRGEGSIPACAGEPL